jgi:2-polyprenyl-6-hydroxyphenyl methylase/3-demethylubiquinone-9 3-methyltransferase
MPSILRRFIDWNRRASRWERSLATRLVPQSGPDGPVDFRDNVLPGLLAPGMRILDVGGGKYPAISPATKRELNLHVVGLDISAEELAQVPPGAYDSVVVGDVSRVHIPEQFDLVFSRTLLEHVADTPAAIANLARALGPNGLMAHVVPCGNAPFAVLNRTLGNKLARVVLFAVFPEKRKNSGFQAYYRDCTPSRLSRLCRDNGLEVVRLTPYYNSDYTSFFVPIYTVEMLRQVTMCGLGLQDFCEGFTIVARAPAAGRAGESESGVAESGALANRSGA